MFHKVMQWKVLRWLVYVITGIIASGVLIWFIDWLSLDCAVKTNGSYSDWLNFFGNVIGGAMTICGVLLAFAIERQHREQAIEKDMIMVDIGNFEEFRQALWKANMFAHESAELLRDEETRSSALYRLCDVEQVLSDARMKARSNLMKDALASLGMTFFRAECVFTSSSIEPEGYFANMSITSMKEQCEIAFNVLFSLRPN